MVALGNMEKVQICCLSAVYKGEDKGNMMCCRNWEDAGRFHHVVLILVGNYEESTNS